MEQITSLFSKNTEIALLTIGFLVGVVLISQSATTATSPVYTATVAIASSIAMGIALGVFVLTINRMRRS